MKLTTVVGVLLLLAGAPSGWTQALSSADIPGNEQPMVVPEPVVQNGYALAPADAPSELNKVSAGSTIGVSNDDNVLSSSANPVSARDYFLSPWLSLEQLRSRAQWHVEYRPTFTFYQGFSQLNRSDQNLSGDIQYRLAPYVSIRFEDTLTKSSSLLEQLGGGAGAAGAPFLQYTSVPLLPRLWDFITNRANIEAAYQFGQNDMTGAGFMQSDLRYSSQAIATGLYNSRSQIGQVFYSRRLFSTEYVGVIYRDEEFTAFPGNSATSVQGSFVFYTAALSPDISLFGSLGVEHSTTYQPQFATTSTLFRTWSPAGAIGLRWQCERRGIAANFAKRVESGGGLIEAVHANRFDVSARYQLSRSTGIQVAALYSSRVLLDWSALAADAAGDGLLASVSLDQQLRSHLLLRVGYGREQQRYAWVAAEPGGVTQNRAWLSLTYDFERSSGGA